MSLTSVLCLFMLGIDLFFDIVQPFTYYCVPAYDDYRDDNYQSDQPASERQFKDTNPKHLRLDFHAEACVTLEGSSNLPDHPHPLIHFLCPLLERG